MAGLPWEIEEGEGQLVAAAMLVLIVMLMDAAIVATFVLHSYEMFASIIGTWLPFALIFLSVRITGIMFERCRSV